MATIKLYNRKVGHYSSEVDYDRRFQAYNQMRAWWIKTLIQWGIKQGYLKPEGVNDEHSDTNNTPQAVGAASHVV